MKYWYLAYWNPDSHLLEYVLLRHKRDCPGFSTNWTRRMGYKGFRWHGRCLSQVGYETIRKSVKGGLMKSEFIELVHKYKSVD